jgi:hypothetical protein
MGQKFLAVSRDQSACLRSHLHHDPYVLLSNAHSNRTVSAVLCSVADEVRDDALDPARIPAAADVARDFEFNEMVWMCDTMLVHDRATDLT